MNDDRAFERVLDLALDQLAAGESPAAILARHSSQDAAALAPLLAAAALAQAGLSGVPVPPPDLARGRARFLSAAAAPAMAQARPARTRGVAGALSRPRRAWLDRLLAALSPLRLALGALLIVLVLVGAGAASAGALPGDGLYPLKRALETARLAFTFDPEARQALDEALAARRRQEAAQVLALGREAALSFRGAVEAVTPGRLVVSGLALLTPAAESFHPGDEVAVLARATRDGRLIATRITLLRPSPRDPTPTPPRPTPAATRPAFASPTPRPSREAPRPTATLARPATELPATASTQPTRRPDAQRPTEPAASATHAPTRPAGATRRPAAFTPTPAATPSAPPSDRPADLAATPTAQPPATPTGRPSDRPSPTPTAGRGP